MNDELLIAELAKMVCAAMAKSLKQYKEISGLGSNMMPEHFAVAYIMLQLHEQMQKYISMTMETNSSTLWNWNAEADASIRKQYGNAIPQEFWDECGTRRCDLVIFRGDTPLKDNHAFFCLIEAKTHTKIDDDVKKIKTWLQYITTCPYGMVVGHSSEDNIQTMQQGADGQGYKLVCDGQAFVEYWARTEFDN